VCFGDFAPQLWYDTADLDPEADAEPDESVVVVVGHQRPAYCEPVAAQLGAYELRGVEELVEDDGAVGAPSARCQDVGTVVRCGPRLGSRAPEVAAVVNWDSGGDAEPVFAEVLHRRVAVDADVCVVPAEGLVDAGLLPEFADEVGFVDDVTEACDWGAALALELIESREQFAVGARRHEVGHQQIG